MTTRSGAWRAMSSPITAADARRRAPPRRARHRERTRRRRRRSVRRRAAQLDARANTVRPPRPESKTRTRARAPRPASSWPADDLRRRRRASRARCRPRRGQAPARASAADSPRKRAIASAAISGCGCASATPPTRLGCAAIGATSAAGRRCGRRPARRSRSCVSDATTACAVAGGERRRAGLERRLCRRQAQPRARLSATRSPGCADDARRRAGGAEIAAEQREAARRICAQDLGRLAVDRRVGASGRS